MDPEDQEDLVVQDSPEYSNSIEVLCKLACTVVYVFASETVHHLVLKKQYERRLLEKLNQA